MAKSYIYPVQKGKRLPGTVGNKARCLRFLIARRYRIPLTHVCTWDAHVDSLEIMGTLDRLENELLEIIDSEKYYAVRSSANVEDEGNQSYAGQFKTVLNVRGVKEILAAVQKVWSSASLTEEHDYSDNTKSEAGAVKMGVIIQEMVHPEVSGVSFSKNPLTGLDEVVVEAVRGSGVSLVQEGITPNRWINKWGEWIEMSDQTDIPRGLIEEVVAATRAVAGEYGSPVDLEWVYDGHDLHWVQLREITSLDNIPIFSNQISKEVLPGLIKPLIWSINVPLVNSAWVRLFTELIGRNDIDPSSLARAFYYRAYFNMGTIGQIFEALGMPRESLELLMGIESGGSQKPTFKPTGKIIVHLPRMLLFALKKLIFGRKVMKFVPSMESRLKLYDSRFWDNSDERLHALSDDELLEDTGRLFRLNQETAYYNIVVPLLMNLYNRLFYSRLSKHGVDPDSFDATRGFGPLKELDPNTHLARLHGEYANLGADFQSRIAEYGYTGLAGTDGSNAFGSKVDSFIRDFGHFSDSGNDFSSIPWRENPDLVVKMIVQYNSIEKGRERISFEELPAGLQKRFLLRMLYTRSRQFRLYREQVSSLYTFGYGLFRDYFLALGERLVHRGVIEQREDVFYLYFDELKEIVQSATMEEEIRELISSRRREMDFYSDVVMPGIIYGDRPPPVEKREVEKLHGTPTSQGYYRGPVRVIRGLNEFEKLKNREVLVIPYADVGWTPLFSRAGAVIAESGGILSHSSIMAREYGIPAVVSVSGACSIKSGIVVTVDGYTGNITLHGEGNT
jgi:pyruvate,water dikinase